MAYNYEAARQEARAKAAHPAWRFAPLVFGIVLSMAAFVICTAARPGDVGNAILAFFMGGAAGPQVSLLVARWRGVVLGGTILYVVLPSDLLFTILTIVAGTRIFHWNGPAIAGGIWYAFLDVLLSAFPLALIAGLIWLMRGMFTQARRVREANAHVETLDRLEEIDPEGEHLQRVLQQGD